MKIFQVTTFYHPVTGGVEAHVAILSKYLIEMGHDVKVLTSDSSKIGVRIKNREAVVDGINVKRFFTFFSLSQYHRFFPGLFFYLLKNDFDIVHVHGFRKIETYMCFFAAKLKRKKIVLTSHNPFPTTTRGKFTETFVKIHDLTFGKWITNKLDKVITILKSENEIFKKRYKVKENRLETVYNGINPLMLEPGDPLKFYEENNIKKEEWKAIVAGCGRLTYAKGFQFLKKAVTELPDVLFFIASGDDGYYKELKALYFDDKNIIFNNKFLPQEKVRDIFAGADIFVLPSIHEATGGVLLEALAQGCAIISTSKGGTIEYLTEEHGIFINPINQDEWLTEIKTILKDPKIKEKLIDNKGNFLKKYRWDSLAKKIEEIYKEVWNIKN